MKTGWRGHLSRHGRDTATLVVVGVFMFVFSLIGNSMIRPLDRLLDADGRGSSSIRIVTQHVSR